MVLSYPYSKIAVFGGSGFIGRYVVEKLAARGVTLIVPSRGIEAAKFLRPLGDVGQINPVACDLNDEAQLRNIMGRVDAAINLVGTMHGTRKQSFDKVHRVYAGNIARAAKQMGCKALTHVSALGADKNSKSSYARSKALGEETVRTEFPGAVILRPSVLFGPEDKFFNLFASMARNFHLLPLIGGGKTRFQPVYVGDVAEAAVQSLADPSCAGGTYTLGGPGVHSFRELMDRMLRDTRQKACFIEVPFGLAKFKAAFLQLMPKPLLTVDQVRLLRNDNVVPAGSKTLADLGIAATALDAVLPGYMEQYWPGGKLADKAA